MLINAQSNAPLISMGRKVEMCARIVLLVVPPASEAHYRIATRVAWDQILPITISFMGLRTATRLVPLVNTPIQVPTSA